MGAVLRGIAHSGAVARCDASAIAQVAHQAARLFTPVTTTSSLAPFAPEGCIQSRLRRAEIMVSSIASSIQSRNFAADVVANLGLQDLAGSLWNELGLHDINLNTVCPVVVDTSRWDNMRDNTPGGMEEWERLETNIPTMRTETCADVASTIVFLCSEEGHQINEQSITIVGRKASSH